MTTTPEREALAPKLENIISGHRINDDDAAWLRALLAASPAAGVPQPLDLKVRIADLIREHHMYAVYHCTRVWDAWNVGTMSEDDFEPAGESDLPDEIADAVVSLLAASPQPPHTEAPAAQDEREALVRDTITQHLTSLYACTRVWEAWGIGTMSEDDFVPASETEFVDELTQALLPALAARAPQAAANQRGEVPWPAPLAEVQVEDPNGVSVMRPPERAYFDAATVQEIVNAQRKADAQAAPAPQPEAATVKESLPVAAEPRITITLRQAEKLLTFFGGHDAEITIAPSNLDSHSGPGLYAWCTDYPEEGSEFLGLTEVDDDLAMNGRAAEPVPAPVQPEAASAERMAITNIHSILYDEGVEPGHIVTRLETLIARLKAAAAKPVQALLYEHDDGRHVVAIGEATFATGDPAWHRVGPVVVHPTDRSDQSVQRGGRTIPSTPSAAAAAAAGKE